MPARLLIAVLVYCCAVGCTRVVVHKHPDQNDKGIRYYRPKPYLLIVPDGAPSPSTANLTTTTSSTQNKPFQVQVIQPALAQEVIGPELDSVQPSGLPTRNSAASTAQSQSTGPMPAPGAGSRGPDSQQASGPRKVSISLHYLPDFAEEYSIRLMPGLGIGELNVKLDNGWNLTSVGMKTDQQTDEIIKATSDLVASASNLFGESGEGARGAVYAMNIPFGFYEAVIATDPCGRKQLYGWRYVGFMPFQACPVRPCGMESVSCGDVNAIYGLVMNNEGVMRFERIAEIPSLSEPGSKNSTQTPRAAGKVE